MMVYLLYITNLQNNFMELCNKRIYNSLPDYHNFLPSYASFLFTTCVFGLELDGTNGYRKLFFIHELRDYKHSHVAEYPSSADPWRVSKGNTEWIPYHFNDYNEPSNLDGVFLLEIGV